MEDKNPLFQIKPNFTLQDVCRVHDLIPMNCGSRMKLRETSDDNSLDYDDNSCLILSLIIHDVRKWKGMNRDKFFHHIMDYIQMVNVPEQLTNSLVSAVDEGMQPNARLDAILLYIWARVAKKNIGLHTNGHIQYYFFNEFQHAIMSDRNTIYLDFDDDHFIPLIKADLLDDSETMQWYDDILKFQENLETRLNKLNDDIAKQLLELDKEDRQTISSHNEQSDLEIAKALQEEEDKKSASFQQNVNMNNKYDVGQYDKERRAREQYRSQLHNRSAPNSWESENNDKFTDAKMCAKCSQVIFRKQGLYWCDNCSKTIDEVVEDNEENDDNDYDLDDGPEFKACGKCGRTIIKVNGLFECPQCEGFDEDKHLFNPEQYDMEKQLTSWDVIDGPEKEELYFPEKNKNAVFKPCKTCGRMIREQHGMFYCASCNEYTSPFKPSRGGTYAELQREQEHLDMKSDHDIREMKPTNDIERHEHAMQIREMDRLDKRDNEGFWDYDKKKIQYNRFGQEHHDDGYVDNDYFDREYPSDARPSDHNNLSTSFRENGGSKFWEKTPQYEDGVTFDPHYDDKYGKYNPNRMNEVLIDKFNLQKAMRESMGINSDDDDEELQRALKESKDMYLDTNVEEHNIFAEDVGAEAEGDWNSDPEDTNYFYNCYFNDNFKLQPDENVPIAIANDSDSYQTDDTTDTNELIALL